MTESHKQLRSPGSQKAKLALQLLEQFFVLFFLFHLDSIVQGRLRCFAEVSSPLQLQSFVRL